MIENFVKKVLENGGRIKPLIVPFEIAKGTGQMNPSVFIDNGKIIVNLRNVQYVLAHSENAQRFPSRWGPLLYTHPENDCTLRTVNVFMELNNDLEPVRINQVDTTKLDIEPKWEFIGLEDARVVRWNDRLYLSGVRRDTTTNGQGRIELSEIIVDKSTVNEVTRTRIEAPNSASYCEKNWMPILDKPFHYVKWCNPVEVVQVHQTEEGKAQAKTVFIGTNVSQSVRDWRGGSQVIPFKGYYLALIHEVWLFNNEIGQKDGYYYHRFLVWDKDWNLVTKSQDFNFMNARIEFACGLAQKDDTFLITFGYQDNCAYILEMPVKFLEEMLYE